VARSEPGVTFAGRQPATACKPSSAWIPPPWRRGGTARTGWTAWVGDDLADLARRRRQPRLGGVGVSPNPGTGA